MSFEQWVVNREELKEFDRILFEKVKTGEMKGTFLHLGCGTRVMDGWTNIDLFPIAPGVVKAQLFDLPYENDSVDGILNIHCLEHLPIRHGRKALKEWFRILKPGGKLWIEMPDIEFIMLELLRERNNIHQFNWYLHTLFGWQAPMDKTEVDNDEYEVDPGQFHCAGYNKQTLRHYLEFNGFKIEKLVNYDGYGTLSMWCIATK